MSESEKLMATSDQTVYMTDARKNFYKLEIVSGNIFSGATFIVYQKIDGNWVSLGERVSNSGIKKGKSLWGLIEVDSYYIHRVI